MSELLMRIEEVAVLLDVPIATLRDWRQRGVGPTSARIGRRVMYRRPEIEAWVEAQFHKTA